MSNPTFVLDSGHSRNIQILEMAARELGWNIVRTDGIDMPGIDTSQEKVIYGGTRMCARAAKALDIALLEPPLDWLVSLPEQYVGRNVAMISSTEIGSIAYPRFVKPADTKSFKARVYRGEDDIPDTSQCGTQIPLIVSDPVYFSREYRCFVLEGRVATASSYLRGDRQPFYDTEGVDDAVACAQSVLDDNNVTYPPAFVIDVGKMFHLGGADVRKGFAVVEANSCYDAGIYGCDPKAVLEVLRHAAIPKVQLPSELEQWVIESDVRLE